MAADLPRQRSLTQCYMDELNADLLAAMKAGRDDLAAYMTAQVVHLARALVAIEAASDKPPGALLPFVMVHLESVYRAERRSAESAGLFEDNDE